MTGAGGLLCRRDLLWMKWNSGNVPKKRQPPQLLKAVDYQLKFEAAINTRCQLRGLPAGGESVPAKNAFAVNFGRNDNSVEKEPQAGN